MIIIASSYEEIQLIEITLNDESPYGYDRNIIEEVGKDGEIRGQKYDADEDAFYYLSLPRGAGISY